MNGSILFLRRLNQESGSPIESSSGPIPVSVRLCPIGASEGSYTFEQRRLAAHRIAAEVRNRHPSMQVKRRPWIEEWCAE